MLRLTLAALAALVALPAAAQISGPAACTNGVARLGGTDYPCRGVDVMSLVPTGVTGPLRTGGMNDIWGWTDPQTGREYALGGTRSGTVFVDVTNPAQPLVLGKMQSTNGVNSTWRDIKVYNNHAFVVSEAPGHGMQVFDLTRLRGLAPLATRDFLPDAVYTGIGKAHNLVINEATGYAYAVGANQSGFTCNAGGLHMVDIRTPAAPVYAGCFDADGYTHDAQCVVYSGPDPDYTGREVCFTSQGRQGQGDASDRYAFVDVTDKAAPRLIGNVLYPNPGYAHQAWLTPDSRFLVANDEFDATLTGTRTIVANVSDLDNPEFVGNYASPAPTYAHNLYTRGRYAFMSNYESGLRIVDLTGAGTAALTEVASFDTYPQGNGRNYQGQWSNYPYFASGTVVVSDIDNGLFVLRPTALATAGEEAPVADGGYALSAPAPNPTSGASTLTLSVAAAQRVTAAVVDALGREVAALVDGPAAPGTALRLTVDTAALPPGVYTVRVTGETFAASRRLVVVR